MGLLCDQRILNKVIATLRTRANGATIVTGGN